MQGKATSVLTAAVLTLFTLLMAVSANAEVDISITNTTVPNPGIVGRNLTYNMNVINEGPDSATNVRVTDTLPAGVTLVSARFRFVLVNEPLPTPIPCTGTTTIICNIGTMGVGNLNGVAVFITVRPQNPGEISNTATVTADQADPESETVETTVVPQINQPEVLDRNLEVRTVISGLSVPTTLAFLGDNDFLVLEKLSGRVKRVVNGVVQNIALDLPVNNFSERGLLGIALHPNFDTNHLVYLYWTCASSVRLGPCIFDSTPSVTEDTAVPDQVPLLGNRVDRFFWDGAKLTHRGNLIRLHAFQEDATNRVPRGNHNGGVIAFGPDGKLYIYIGDNGRRGWMQNVLTGFGPDGHDDQFGGPAPDNAHLTGVILRLNDDGSTPDDNPFVGVSTGAGAEVDANIHKVFAYGIRNGFGFAFDPLTGNLWESQNGDDSGSEINLIEAGFNGGWVQIMGRLDNIATYKEIETSPVYFGLQQIRWPPTLIADSPEEARRRLFNLPGSRYTDPLLNWKFAVDPAGFGFIEGRELGRDLEGDLLVGGATSLLFDGHLYRFKLTRDRRDLDLRSDPELNDTRVIEDMDKWDITGSKRFLFGKGFGVTTNIQTAPNGNLFVVSLSLGAVFEIRRR